MSSIALIIFGLIIGVIAEIFMFGNDLVGFTIIILIGIAAIFMGRYIGRAVGLFRRPRARQGGRSHRHSARGHLHLRQ